MSKKNKTVNKREKLELKMVALGGLLEIYGSTSSQQKDPDAKAVAKKCLTYLDSAIDVFGEHFTIDDDDVVDPQE